MRDRGCLRRSSSPRRAAAARRHVTQRGFVEARARSVSAGGAERSDAARSAICSRARRCSSSRRRGSSSPAGVDLRANSHDQVDDAGGSISAIAALLRPALSLRRLSATSSRGPLTVDAGKQFIRWGKTDIVNPTDRFAPRDFLNVVDTEFLAVTGVRACGHAAAATRSRRSGCRASRRAACRCSISAGRVLPAEAAMPARRRRRGAPRRIADGRPLGPHRRPGTSTRCRSSMASITCRTSGVPDRRRTRAAAGSAPSVGRSCVV